MNNMYCVIRPKGNVIVTIMPNQADGKYHFVNLTHEHICPCAFDTVDDALKDMDKKIIEGDVISYHKID